MQRKTMMKDHEIMMRDNYGQMCEVMDGMTLKQRREGQGDERELDGATG